VGEPRRVAWLRKVSSCCECQGFVPALVLGLVPAVCSAQGERFHCRRFGVLSSQDEGAGALSGEGGVLQDDRLLLGQAGLRCFAFDASTLLHLRRSRVLRSCLRTSRTSAGFLVFLVFAVVLDVVSCFSILVSSSRFGFINLKLGTLCLLSIKFCAITYGCDRNIELLVRSMWLKL
jgi:hypothetical protein